MTQTPANAAAGNRLLATLSADTLQQLNATTYEAQRGDRLFGPETSPPPRVTFPHMGTMLSLMRTAEEGITVEVGVVGAEGAAPLHTVLSPLPVRSESVVQVEGAVTTIASENVRRMFAAEERFRNAMLAYSSVYLDQVSQNAVCNRLHTIEQRLAKWLLVTRDRAGKDKLDLTHDFIAHMLGVHRPGVTIAIQALELDGAIRATRGSVIIQSLEVLEARTCECRGVLLEGWNALMK